MTSPFKGASGLARIVKAAGYSMAGLRAALQHESAFRQEVALAVALIPIALVRAHTGLEKAVLVASVLLVLIVELLNSALESVVDRISPERHELSKRAKDMGSAAVFLALVNLVAVWLFIFLS